MTDREWRDSLKPGDKVIVSSYTRGVIPLVDTVTRLTKTQIVLKRNGKYLKSTGHRVGYSASYNGYVIRPWSEEAEAEIALKRERALLEKRVYDLNPRELTIEQLRAIVGVLDSDVNVTKEAS